MGLVHMCAWDTGCEAAFLTSMIDAFAAGSCHSPPDHASASHPLNSAGVCALNIEAMSVMNRGMPPGGANPAPLPVSGRSAGMAAGRVPSGPDVWQGASSPAHPPPQQQQDGGARGARGDTSQTQQQQGAPETRVSPVLPDLQCGAKPGNHLTDVPVASAIRSPALVLPSSWFSAPCCMTTQLTCLVWSPVLRCTLPPAHGLIQVSSTQGSRFMQAAMTLPLGPAAGLRAQRGQERSVGRP